MNAHFPQNELARAEGYNIGKVTTRRCLCEILSQEYLLINGIVRYDAFSLGHCNVSLLSSLSPYCLPNAVRNVWLFFFNFGIFVTW